MQTFIAVAEELHFGHAAERLHIAQPAVSQQIQNIEADLGVQLFRRDKRSVELTPAGQAFLEPCRAALESIEAASAIARNSASGETGLVRIGFSAWLTSDFLTILSSLLAQKYPGITYRIGASQTADAMQHDVRDSKLDIAIVAGPITETSLSTLPLAPQRMGVVVPVGHPFEKKDEIPFSALHDQPLIALPPLPGFNVRNAIYNGCKEAGFVPRIDMEISDGLSVNLLNINGIGLSFLGSGAQSFITSAQRFRPLTDPVIEVPTHVAWKAANLTPTLQRVLEVCTEAAEIYRSNNL
jgi:DNA-binding transcriptional LysR family regulator